MLSEKDYAKFEKVLNDLRTGTNACRFATYKVTDAGGTKQLKYRDSAVCTGDYQSSSEFDGVDYLLISFNGETPKDKGSGGIQGGIYDEYTFGGGEISATWLDFMLSEDGPWAELLPFIINKDDRSKINMETGFIIENPNEAPAEALFTFWMATRYAQENHHRAKFVHYLVHNHGLECRLAYLVAYAYSHIEGAGRVRVASPPRHTFQMQWLPLFAKSFYNNDTHPCAKVGEFGLCGNWGANKWWKATGLNAAPPPPVGSIEEAINYVKGFLNND